MRSHLVSHPGRPPSPTEPTFLSPTLTDDFPFSGVERHRGNGRPVTGRLDGQEALLAYRCFNGRCLVCDLVVIAVT